MREVFKELRTETSYFRKLGHEAMRSSIARAEFDRASSRKPALAAAPPPAASPALAKASAS